MAFFDNLKEKLEEAGQAAAEKTKELAELTKLKASVANEEKKIKAAYLAIGKAYVEANPDCDDDLFKEEVAAVIAANANIEALKKQMEEVKAGSSAAVEEELAKEESSVDEALEELKEE